MASLAIIGGGFDRPLPYSGAEAPARLLREDAGTPAGVTPPQPVPRVHAPGPEPRHPAPRGHDKEPRHTRPDQDARPRRTRPPTLVARPAAAADEATVTRFLAQRLAQETARQGLYIDPHPRGIAAYRAWTAPEPAPSVDLSV